jgi:hypothetical protein
MSDERKCEPLHNNPSRARTGNCADCRFWNRKGDPWERRAREGETEDEWGYRVPTKKQKCLRVLHANGSREGEADDDPAIVTDGSGYAAAFWTEPTFGCTSFEPGAE